MNTLTLLLVPNTSPGMWYSVGSLSFLSFFLSFPFFRLIGVQERHFVSPRLNPLFDPHCLPSPPWSQCVADHISDLILLHIPWCILAFCSFSRCYEMPYIIGCVALCSRVLTASVSSISVFCAQRKSKGASFILPNGYYHFIYHIPCIDVYKLLDG